jgi:putative sterol carrier protein
MSVADVEAALTAKLAEFSALNASVKIDFQDGNRIFIDGTKSPATLTHDDGDADCTLMVSSEDMANMLHGALDPTMAFMTGKLKVTGSTGIAMKLAGILK